jgi:ribosomal protein S18 acetylase RimI-like enzyme
VHDVRIELRRGSDADADAIRDLTRAAYVKWIPAIGREPKPMSVDYRAAVRSSRFDLLYLDGILAALIETIDQGDRLLIENVAVSPDFQRRGLGSRLMLHAEDIARALGHERIWLYTNRCFTGNVELYARLGYEVDSEEPIDAGMMRTNMSKRISGQGA